MLTDLSNDFQRTFLQAKQFLSTEFPKQLNITGGNQPIEPFIQLILNILSAVQLFTVACAIFGDRVFFGKPPPMLYYKIKGYAFGWMALIFWIIPQILNKWVITGAFEVFVDGNLVFSKLEQGRMPTAQDLMAPLIELGLTQKVDEA